MDHHSCASLNFLKLSQAPFCYAGNYVKRGAKSLRLNELCINYIVHIFYKLYGNNASALTMSIIRWSTNPSEYIPDYPSKQWIGRILKG